MNLFGPEGLGPHAGFIVAAYAITGLVIAGLIVRLRLERRRLLGAIATIEARRDRGMPPGPGR